MISGKLKEEEWYLNFRIDVHCFMELVNTIRDHVQPYLKSFRSDAVTGEKRVAMVLYYLKDLEHIWCIFGNTIKIITDSLLCCQYNSWTIFN